MLLIKGTIALIGSGELSATMVETHKMLLSEASGSGSSLFLDTPAGFQENVDLISGRAVDFFKNRVQDDLKVVSLKSAEHFTEHSADQFFRLFNDAKYVLVGPGSPTYTVRQLKETPVPSMLNALIARGGCLAVASAAALTVGSHTIPVYEIYKVGEELHWVDGLNILGKAGIDAVVVPHWNNAEGGNHDTRFCYMGEKRFNRMEAMLPKGKVIIGLDEHTACLLRFSSQTAQVQGLGRVTIRMDGSEVQYSRGEEFSLSELLGGGKAVIRGSSLKPGVTQKTASQSEDLKPEDGSFWKKMHNIEAVFNRALEEHDYPGITTQLLEADRVLWQAQLDLENPEFVSQGRELFREMIVLAGSELGKRAAKMPDSIDELIEQLVALREEDRLKKDWPRADRIRAILGEFGVVLEDTATGPRWYFS